MRSGVSQPEQKVRLAFIDELRGLMMLFVCLYHFGYDLNMIFGVPMDWFWADWPVQGGRDCAAGMMMAISGFSCTLSSSNMRRGRRTFGIALLLSVLTFLFMPSERILFGVLHYYGVCMMLWAVLDRYVKKAPAKAGVVLSLMLFAFFRFLPQGDLLLPFAGRIRLPEVLYRNRWLFWLGFPHSGFFSADYYPILPWGMLFLAGGFTGVWLKEAGFPQWLYQNRSRFLAFVGRRTMAIYLLHQPVLISILWCYFRFRA